MTTRLVVGACLAGALLLSRPVSGQLMPMGDDRPVLQVRAHSARGIVDDYLGDAAEVAYLLLRQAGIDSEWQLCGQDGCQDGSARSAPIVVILQAGPDAARPNACGRAAHGSEEGRGTVRIWVPCVEDVARRLAQLVETKVHPLLGLQTHADLTGAAVAHEIGHLLGLRHGGGLMRERLDRSSILALREGRLAFATHDAAAMRRTLLLLDRRAVLARR